MIAATRNEAKIEELARLVADIATVGPPPHDISLEDLENDDAEAGADASFLRIAAAKACAVSAALAELSVGELVVATDGGLLIPALGDEWEPTRTRRFAGAVSDVERARTLLRRAEGLTGEERTIGWREALVVARDGVVIGRWEAESAPGLLATDVDAAMVDRGGGFWVPAIWRCPEFGGRRLAELTETERRARVDHWSRLGANLRQFMMQV